MIFQPKNFFNEQKLKKSNCGRVDQLLFVKATNIFQNKSQDILTMPQYNILFDVLGVTILSLPFEREKSRKSDLSLGWWLCRLDWI